MKIKIGWNFVQGSLGLKTNVVVNAKSGLRANCFKLANNLKLILWDLSDSSMWLLMQEEFAICLIMRLMKTKTTTAFFFIRPIFIFLLLPSSKTFFVSWK